MIKNYPFGRFLTKQNYQALRSLAKKLSYKEFLSATSFGRGIHNRLRRFPAFEGYRNYTRNNAKKYYPRRQKKTITLKDVYGKLLEIEKLLER